MNIPPDVNEAFTIAGTDKILRTSKVAIVKNLGFKIVPLIEG
jgi:hypothetical protein